MPRQTSSETEKKAEAKKLRALRDRMGMTLRELAVEFKVNHSAISLWENGERTIPGPVLKLIEIYEAKLKK